ncbi:MAG: hypothetical protein FWE06_03795 [Oscillospiraceae bacterium]|nr:hypothetical protein [Oscillospiraceae bacterium]
MKKTKFIALFLIAALLVGATLGASASASLPADILTLPTASWTAADETALPAGVTVTGGGNNPLVYTGNWAPWSRVNLATPIEIPHTELGNTYVSFDIDVAQGSGAETRAMLGLIVQLQTGENTWSGNLHFFRAHGDLDPMGVGAHDDSHSIDYLLDMGLDNMPDAAVVTQMRAVEGGAFRIVAFTVIADTVVTINEFRVHAGENGNGGNGNGTPPPTTASPSPAASPTPPAGAGTGTPAPGTGNPKTFDPGVAMIVVVGLVGLAGAGALVVPKLIKKDEK